MYRLTPAGEEQLQAAVEALAETHLAIERYLCRHALAQSRALEFDGDDAPPTRPRPSGVAALRRSVR
jgi:DNA-binding PadR family transcriptional regulator